MLDSLGLDLVIAGGNYAHVFQPVQYPRVAGVHWVGFMTDAELRALYERAALFVFPSRYEGFGFPPLEAMACGCPVVMSNRASLPEVGGESALYCDPDEPGALIDAVQSILADSKLRSRLVAAGRKRAKQFTWRESAKRTWQEIS